MNRYIFHLSIPVLDLASAARFYVEALGARIGRENEQWLDVLLWGHQITLQLRPEEVLPLEQQGKRHFGVVLPWEVWHDEVGRMEKQGVHFHERPTVERADSNDGQAKAYLADPSGNVIELKAYSNVERTLKLPNVS